MVGRWPLHPMIGPEIPTQPPETIAGARPVLFRGRLSGCGSVLDRRRFRVPLVSYTALFIRLGDILTVIWKLI